ncbi:single-stranded DNA-binding protein [Altererythrobacter sp. Root672]|uniref:single-stranded DNA-binding protein n=1 Tax=Altererythrobacter sp. Root672 TaxID=1736584 RepID=UPI0006F86D5F|nr:single-stranded DNA-binding protein [Altererythrobacter sp. Root672]KRA84222.1 hypothetical protein ASD76_09620 [Altererythrobacter sp. Root672]
MITVAAIGRLMQAPERRETAKGSPMATVQLAVKPKPEGDAVPIDVIAFGTTAKALVEHEQGDLVQLFGRLQWNQYTDRYGTSRASWGIVADQLTSARTASSRSAEPRRRNQQWAR